MNKRVLCVGNCVPDHRAICSVIQSRFSAQVVQADSLTEALAQLRRESHDLVLVNRILDRDGSDGLEVIRQIKADAALRQIPVMMITNFAEHQLGAQQAGAVEGFGKLSLHSPDTAAKLERYLT